MSVLMFSTSIGFSIDMHFCQGTFKNLSFLGDARSCHDKVPHAKNQASCHTNNAPSNEIMDSKGCCDNKTIAVQLEDNFVKAEIANFSNHQMAFLLAFAVTSLNINSTSEVDLPYLNYKPPLLDKDIPILTQTFRC
ncbi:MAG: hypothetical protein R2753_09065 [Chitinophagales bacterium]